MSVVIGVIIAVVMILILIHVDNRRLEGKRKKSASNFIFDEYHEIWDLNLNKREDYDEYMRRDGYYVKNEYEESIVYEGPNKNHFIIVEKTKFEEETKMKIYHIKTQEDFDALMAKFKKEGVTWIKGILPRYWDKNYPYITLKDKVMGFATLGLVHEIYRDVPIIKYKANDTVNNPSHYNTGGIETLDYIKAKVDDYPSYVVGNIIKYITRYEHKNGLEDLKKAQFYLDDLIEWMEEK
nr:DUF3310 domain-containing protein [Listeria booriae]